MLDFKPAPPLQAAPQPSAEPRAVAIAKPPADMLMLAVLSLEASETAAEIEDSIERIQDLGVPKNIPEPSPTPVDRECKDTGSSAFCVYTVIAGDTLSGIAQEFDFPGNGAISGAEMLAQSNKPDVVSSDHIEPGQNIRIPRESGILHTAFSSESVGEVAAKYGVSVEAIVSSPYNSLAAGSALAIGQEVLVPDPQQLPVNQPTTLVIPEPTPGGDETASAGEPTEDATESPEAEVTPTPEVTTAATPEETPEPTTTPQLAATPSDIPLLGPTSAPTAVPTATPTPDDDNDEDDDDEPPAAGSGFLIWPVHGPISSYFGPSHPLGIDIDLYQDPDAPIVAARGGTVVFAGGDACCSYGLYVIIDHGDGIRTLYAHLSRIQVDVGEEVRQGERIGRGGRTGYATGNHLHFELHYNDNVLDPLQYLP